VGPCGQDYPSTSDYFDRDSSKEDGLRSVCKLCRADEYDQRQKMALDERIKMIDEASLRLIDKLARSGSDVPHMAELYQRIMEAFDGVGGYAAHFMAQYLSAAPGSSIREKMLNHIMKLGIKVSESGHAQIPVELMTDEDLQIELSKQARQYLVRYVDGEVTKAS